MFFSKFFKKGKRAGEENSEEVRSGEESGAEEGASGEESGSEHSAEENGSEGEYSVEENGSPGSVSVEESGSMGSAPAEGGGSMGSASEEENGPWGSASAEESGVEEKRSEEESGSEERYSAEGSSSWEGSVSIAGTDSAEKRSSADRRTSGGAAHFAEEADIEETARLAEEADTERAARLAGEADTERAARLAGEADTEGAAGFAEGTLAEDACTSEGEYSAEKRDSVEAHGSGDGDAGGYGVSTDGKGSAEEDSPLEEEKPEEEKRKKKGFFARLKEGLAKTRDNIVKGIDSVFNGFTAIDDDFYEELEEILIMGDIGVNATTEIVARLKAQVKERHIKEPKECKQLLIEGIKEQMRVDAAAYDFEKQQSIIMVIGVNGVGKTTSVGKLAGKLKEEGRKVLIAAADTFRAAAGDQLAEWARRADVPMVGGREGADPASVVFDAVSAARARGVDVLLVDTAGRLHNKKNLMEELRKMNRIIDKEFPDAHRENLIVLDGTTGQNAMVQAREFGSVAELTGIILTKMDGTAKGGIAVAIQSELQVPVKYIGVGETIDDLQKFDSDEFVNALFDVKLDEEEE